MPAMTSAERARLHRARLREGLAVVSVTVELNRVTEALMDAGFLDADSDNRSDLEAAIADLIAEFVENETRDAKRRAARGIFRPWPTRRR